MTMTKKEIKEALIKQRLNLEKIENISGNLEIKLLVQAIRRQIEEIIRHA